MIQIEITGATKEQAEMIAVLIKAQLQPFVKKVTSMIPRPDQVNYNSAVSQELIIKTK